MRSYGIFLAAIFASTISGGRAQDARWSPAPGPLKTRWAAQVSPTNARPEYPRPQMVRKDWLNLNGLWDYGLSERDAASMPTASEGLILVPYPFESSLSGVGKRIREDQKLWYRRTFTVPEKWKGQRVLLHFGAVDWEATVFLNGRNLGTHRGGYDGFSFDVTDALKKSGPQELQVSVWDPADGGPQPRGKQVRRPEGIWYTPTTGIWQTVWLEPVDALAIKSLHIVPDIDRGVARVDVELTQPAQKARIRITANALLATKDVSASIKSQVSDVLKTGNALNMTVHVGKFMLWTPETPLLYNLEVSVTGPDGKVRDTVTSYFGMRKMSLGKDEKGHTRLLLNNKPYFQLGPLDQGFWPDGLYTAPTDEALRYDIEVTKRLGFNMCRKHVKVEPDRWYYWCDKLGLLVWQDMPSGDRYIGPNDRDITRDAASEAIYRTEWKAIIEQRRNHPSIVMWVPFNEGWGQFKTAEIAKWTKQLDPSRLVNSVSGWADRAVGDVFDWHVYPGPGSPRPEAKRAAVLGEYGGLGLPLEGHTWQPKGNWGYRTFTTREALTDAFLELQRNLHPLVGEPGCSAAVYTQTTDVEVEVNGLMTYDREIIKMDPARVRAANLALMGPAPSFRTVVPTSERAPQTWSFTTENPGEGWYAADFDSSAWKIGAGGFGTADTPGTTVRTTWNTGDIWLRRTVKLDYRPLHPLFLRVHHDEDAEIYLNGVLAARVGGYTSAYTTVAIDERARGALRAGENTIAVHCHQTGGGQYIDVGVQELVPAPR